ncbi:MAG: hypothetical protein PVJ57_08360 [Phycisphaerae bacterium]
MPGESAGPVEPAAVPSAESAPPSRWLSAGVRLLAILVAAAAALLSTNNWCFVILPAALAAIVVDYVVSGIRPWSVLRLIVAVAVGLAVGRLLSVGPDWAFQEAFGVDAPAGVRDVHIFRHYVGGPGEHILIIEFTANPDVVKALLSLHPVVTNSETAQSWHAAGGGWPQAFDDFAGPCPMGFARAAWLRIRPLAEPEVFDFGGIEASGGRLVLFHEPHTDRCVALHVRW